MQRVMLRLMRKNFLVETLDTHIAKVSSTDATGHRLSKELLTSCSPIAPIATFVGLKTDSAIADQNTGVAKETKKEKEAATGAQGKNIKAPSTHSNSGNDEPHCSRTSRY